jgi:hypothetical protein
VSACIMTNSSRSRPTAAASQPGNLGLQAHHVTSKALTAKQGIPLARWQMSPQLHALRAAFMCRAAAGVDTIAAAPARPCGARNSLPPLTWAVKVLRSWFFAPTIAATPPAPASCMLQQMGTNRSGTTSAAAQQQGQQASQRHKNQRRDCGTGLQTCRCQCMCLMTTACGCLA